MEKLEMQEVQKAALEILKEVAAICEEQNLRYYLIYGTLIGAIRHKGFIPWDDDLDIMMPREDYIKILDYFAAHKEEHKHLEVFNPDTCKDYPYMITRISDNRYRIETDNEKDCGMGVFIDIYPYDGLGRTWEEAVKFGMKGDRISSCCFLATREHYKWDQLNTFVKNVLRMPLFYVSKLMGKKYFQNKLSALAGLKLYDECEYIGCVVWLSGGERDMFKREWFDEYIEVPFEDASFRVPKEYDLVLKQTYGDYMKLPPVEERIGHHYYSVYRNE